MTDLDSGMELRGLAADLMRERDALIARVRKLEAERDETFRHPLDRMRTCKACGKKTRITTAGCDHCDHEDK